MPSSGAAIGRGGLREALARALLYVGMARGRVDERGFEAIRRIRRAHPHHAQHDADGFKRLIREQFFMLLLDEEAALAAIPGLLPERGRRSGAAALRRCARC